MRFTWTRWRIRACLLAVALLVPGAAAAQTTTADGASALVRGDYETAVRLLRPLAENTAQPDPLAQFFMAMLYASGHGGGDTLRACGLYFAAATATNPLATQSLTLARALQDYNATMPPPLRCTERTALDYRPLPSTSFTLGPDHWVTMDAGGATVGYNGIEKRTRMTNGGVGVEYLPLRHTALDVSQPAATRRDFIQMFYWSPDLAADQPTWTLSWVLFEVIGADVRAVAGTGRGNVMRITAPQPPASLDVETVVQVRLGANGEAEWIILTDPPRRGVIPFGTRQ